MQIALKTAIKNGWFENAASAACNLCELLLILGRIYDSWDYARQAVDLADRGDQGFIKMFSRTYVAKVLLDQGFLVKAKKIFIQAENMQRKGQPEYPFLYALQGFRYCELLLGLGQYCEVVNRAEKTIEWARKEQILLPIALDHLSLGQAYLRQSQVEGGRDFTQSAAHMDQAVAGLRKAGSEEFIVLGLLARADMYQMQKDWDHAHRDLKEAMARAKRAGMALYQADAHLEYVRFYLAQGQPDKARPHLAIAKKMVAEIGYGRRHQDILDLEAQLRRTS